MVEKQVEKQFSAREVLEGAEPFGAALDFAVQALNQRVLADAAVDDVALFLLSVIPAHDFFDCCHVLPESVSDDLCRTHACILPCFLEHGNRVRQKASCAEMPCKHCARACAFHNPEPVSNAFDFDVCLVDMPHVTDCWLHAGRDFVRACEHPLAHAFVRDFCAKPFEQFARDSAQARTDIARVKLNRCNDVMAR